MSDQSPLAPLAVKVQLDIERTIQYDRLATYHMSKLPFPSTPQDLIVGSRSFAALVQWIWACLAPKDRVSFPTPESLVPQITEEKIPALIEAFHRSFMAVQPPKIEGDDPNVKGSTIGHSPASS